MLWYAKTLGFGERVFIIIIIIIITECIQHTKIQLFDEERIHGVQLVLHTTD